MADFISSDGCYVLAAFFSLAAISISIYNIMKHVIFYTQPEYQLWIVRVLIIVPIYALTSWFSLRFSEDALYFETIRDVYEAFVIYCFLQLILEYVGGEKDFVDWISNRGPMAHPWPVKYCFPPMSLNTHFLRSCKKGTLQFVVVKPVMAILSLIMLGQGKYETQGYQICLLIVYNTSYTLALYALLLFYMACHEKPEVARINPVWKFFAVKSIVFCTYWQSLVVPRFTDDWSAWNDFILCIEMAGFAILHYYSFPWYEFKHSPHGMPPTSTLSSIKKIFSVKDVMSDTYYNFHPSYQEYHVHGETKKVKTFTVGNLDQIKESNKSRGSRGSSRTNSPRRNNGGFGSIDDDDIEEGESPTEDSKTENEHRGFLSNVESRQI